MSRGRNYDKHIKAEAVSLVIDSGKSIASVSRELDIAKSTVGNWVRDYKDDGPNRLLAAVICVRTNRPIKIYRKD